MISIGRMFAIGLVFMLGTAGWMILGTASDERSMATRYDLGRSVSALWGQPLTQLPPAITTRRPGAPSRTRVAPSRAKLSADLELQHRRKGLLWFATYAVQFQGRYEITNRGPVRQRYQVSFTLPDRDATYVGVQVRVDDELKDARPRADGTLVVDVIVPPASARTAEFRYQTRGLDEWRYRPGHGRVALPELDVDVQTNFSEVDFPDGGLSPMQNAPLPASDGAAGGGRHLRWHARDLLTSRDIAVRMPQRLNPGPVAARMSYFAPVGLLFFFVALAGITVVRALDIHPVHYLFVTAGFFAFHLLFAYLVDVLPLYGAFAAAAVVSLTLVLAYLRAALGRGFPLAAGGGAQAVYLVLFSWSFFLPGSTGLTVTIGAVATLAVLMALTAKTDWGRVFRPKPAGGGSGVGSNSSAGQAPPRDAEPPLELDVELPDGA
ncbi:MAG: inner membrane CreD family protein [Pseudomonadota bacterium]